MTKHRIYSISFASVYPHYVAKAEKKGRTKAEVDEIVRWLTGYSQPADRARTTDAGFDAHLVKPVTVDVVEKTIRGLFRTP